MKTTGDILPPEAVARLAECKRAATQALPGVEKLVLFGSRARGQAHADSDYDVAVLLRDLSNRRHVRHMLSNLTYEHILSGFFIRPLPLPPDYFAPLGKQITGLTNDIIRDVIEIT